MFEDPARQLDARADVEFAEDLSQVERNGVRADEQLIGDLLVGEPLGDETQNFALPRS
jgi:hypothetical protein